MPIQIGVAGIPICCKELGFEEGLKWLNQNGLCEEVQFVRQVWMTKERAKAIKELNDSLKVPLSVHAPYYINLANPEKVEASKKRILESCDRAEIIGADIVVFHPGFYGKDKQKAFELVRKACAEMTKQTSVLLGLETMGRQAQFGTVDEILEINKELKNCVLVVDFAHIFARNNGKIDFVEILDKVKKIDHLHSHFTGVAFSNSDEKHHLPVSSNQPNFKELANELKKRKTDIMVICESPLLEKDALLMKKMF
jgi:deoxyribonuclease-4